LWVGINLAVLLLAAGSAAAQKTARGAVPKTRANELTLAGMHPGRDKVRQFFSVYGKPHTGKPDDLQVSWRMDCRKESLHVNGDSSGRIAEVRVEFHENLVVTDCVPEGRSPWRTGKGLTTGDPLSLVLRLYGEPDSRSPSTKDGQRLELLYYAFDWAGPDVPQVMEVLCTVEKDGKPGRVMEITLAASSL
jgi:hypothetical protein